MWASTCLPCYHRNKQQSKSNVINPLIVTDIYISLSHSCIHIKVKVKDLFRVQIFKLRVVQRTFTFPPGEVSANLKQPATVDQTFNLCTRYPLLLGGQRQCGFKPCPRILYMTGVPGIEPQTPSSRVQHLTTQPRTPSCPHIQDRTYSLCLVS